MVKTTFNFTCWNSFPIFVDLTRHGLITVTSEEPLALKHAERGRVAAIETRNAADLGHAVVHIGDVAQPRDAPAGQGDACLPELQRGRRATEHANRLFAAADLQAPARRVEVDLPQLLIDVDGRDPERLHARRIELHADLAIDAAAALHLGDAVDRQQSLGDCVVDEPAELFLGHLCGADGVVYERSAFDVDALHQGFLDALGQIAAHLGDGIAHVGHGTIDRCADLELDIDQRRPFERGGSDVLDVADARDRAFDLLDDLGLDLRSGQRLAALTGDLDQRKGNVRADRLMGRRMNATTPRKKSTTNSTTGGTGLLDRPR